MAAVTEATWPEVKRYLKIDGYSNVATYVEELKKKIVDAEVRIKHLKDELWLLKNARTDAQ